MVDTSTEAVTKLLDGVTPGPWGAEYDDYGEEIWFGGEGCGTWTVGPCFIGGDGHDPDLARIMDADARFIAASRDLVPALLAERDALRAKCEAVLRHIPMDYLRRHDMPGASGPTSALQLDKAMQDYAEDRWKLIDRLKSLLAERDEARSEVERLKAQPVTVQDAVKVREVRALIEAVDSRVMEWASTVQIANLIRNKSKAPWIRLAAALRAIADGKE